MSALHGPTLVTIGFLLAIVSTALLVDVWRRSGYPRYLAAWAICCGAATLSLALSGLLDLQTSSLAIVAINGLSLLSLSLLWAGARWLKAGDVRPWLVALPTVLWVAGCMVPAFFGSETIRIITLSLAAATLVGGTAQDLLRGRPSGAEGGARTSLAVLLGIFGLLHLLRASLVLGGVVGLGNEIRMTVAALLPAFVSFAALAIAHARAATDEAQLRASAMLREAEALRETWRTVEQMHAHLPALLFLREVTPDGARHLIYSGGDREAVTGWPMAEIGQQELRHWAEPGTPFQEAYQEIIRHGSATLDWRMRRPDGGWNRMRMAGRVVETRPDGTVLVAGYNLNVTAEYEAQARIAAAGRLASLGEMAVGLAHELKQPLQAISLVTEIAQISARQAGAGDVAEQLTVVVEQVRRAGKVIEHLRSFALGGGGNFVSGPVSLGTAVHNALDLMAGHLSDAGITVELSLGEPSPVVMGDLVAIEQVLVNLLLNARDAMTDRPETEPRRIRLRAGTAADGATASLRLADTGGGIPAALLDKVFEPFTTTKGPAKGTGLGLSICHGLMKTMGGSIEVENDGEGAVFTATFLVAGRPAPGN